MLGLPQFQSLLRDIRQTHQSRSIPKLGSHESIFLHSVFAANRNG